MNVNEENSINYSAVYACVRVIAETVASLPLHVYQRLPNGGKQRAPDHPLYDILHDMPNPEMTSFTLREVMQGHLLLWGNAYAYIDWDDDGFVRSIWPIPPHRVDIERDVVTNQLRYNVIMPDNTQRVLQEHQMLHIPGFGFDGLKGLSPIGLARQAIGLGLAAEEFGARFFGNGTNLGGVVKHPGKLSETAAKNLRASINETYSGLGRSHRVMLLEEGMDFVKIGIPPEDAQFLETRKFQVNEIARIFRVPPHMIGDLERATFSNIEHQSIEFVVHTIRPWLVRWEQALKWKLFLPSERKSFFAEFVVDGLLRGDTKSRYEAYAIGRQNGWLSADDIRELENMNPLPDDQGKIYLIPANMMPANQVGSVPAGQQEVTEKDAAGQQEDRRHKAAWEERSMRSARLRRQLAIIQKPLFRDAAARVVRREVNDVRKAAKEFLTRRNLSDFNQWLIEYYEQYPSFVEENMLPIFLSYAELVQAVAAQEIGLLTGMTEQMVGFVRAYVTNFINRYVGSSLNQLQAIAREAQAAGEDPLPLIEQRLDEWEDKRPDKVANREVIQAGNAIALATYTSGGVLYKRWNAIGKDCPYCRRLDGMVIGIDQTFVNVGQDFQPEGAEKPLRPETSIGHPPLHRGCDCMISSAM